MRKRKKYAKELKARVALEALKGEKSIAQISSEYEVHSNRESAYVALGIFGSDGRSLFRFFTFELSFI